MRERPGASHCSEPLYGEQRRLFYLSAIKIELDRNKYSQLTEGNAIADPALKISRSIIQVNTAAHTRCRSIRHTQDQYHRHRLFHHYLHQVAGNYR